MIHRKEPQDRAAAVLHEYYGLAQSDALDAAYDAIRTAARAQVARYSEQLDRDDIDPAKRDILLIRIDTLEKLAVDFLTTEED